jgi:hypothetical protein
LRWHSPHWLPLVRPKPPLSEQVISGAQPCNVLMTKLPNGHVSLATSEAPLYSELTIVRPNRSVSETIGVASSFNAATTAPQSASGRETSGEPDRFSASLGISKPERRRWF